MTCMLRVADYSSNTEYKGDQRSQEMISTPVEDLKVLLEILIEMISCLQFNASTGLHLTGENVFLRGSVPWLARLLLAALFLIMQ